jgi:hypothetical protein
VLHLELGQQGTQAKSACGRTSFNPINVDRVIRAATLRLEVAVLIVNRCFLYKKWCFHESALAFNGRTLFGRKRCETALTPVASLPCSPRVHASSRPRAIDLPPGWPWIRRYPNWTLVRGQLDARHHKKQKPAPHCLLPRTRTKTHKRTNTERPEA